MYDEFQQRRGDIVVILISGFRYRCVLTVRTCDCKRFHNECAAYHTHKNTKHCLQSTQADVK